MARLALPDLFLDTLPYNAGTTANDILWMGTPILTCSGRTYISRMCGSLLTAVGLPDLITFSLEEYERKAVQLGRNRGGSRATSATWHSIEKKMRCLIFLSWWVIWRID